MPNKIDYITSAPLYGATTLSIVTSGIMTFSIMTLGMTTFSIMTVGIMTLSIMTLTQHYGFVCDTQHK